MSQPGQQGAKLLYFITEDWFFCSHFLARARAAREAGYVVQVLTRVERHGQAIAAAGIEVLPLDVQRRSLSLLSGLASLVRLVRVLRRERPQLLHQIALKPILLGSLAARLAGVPRVINAPVGMGYVFTSRSRRARWLRPLMRFALGRLLSSPGGRVVFENADDMNSLVAAGLATPQAARLIRGAGVDVARFVPVLRPARVPVVVLVARMLWDKGVGEFVAAARLLKFQGVAARLVLVGAPDPCNPACIPAEQLASWAEEGVVEWWGERSDMPAVLAAADIACLPSYREGLPKSLLEAMACGLPCVASDVPGCREAVRHLDNGLLVPARDAEALSGALATLIADAGQRGRMGERGRARAEEEFSDQRIIAETLAMYEEVLSTCRP